MSSSADGAAVLRLFSGVHLGAEIVLSEGTCLIGSDDSCDIILRDSDIAPRHAQLDISRQAGKNGQPVIELHVHPLDGTVEVNGTPLNDNDAIPPRTPCLFGMTILGWTEPANSEGGWELLREQIRQLQKPLQQENSAADESPSAPPPTPKAQADNVVADQNPVELEQIEMPSPPRGNRRKLSSWCIGIGVVIGLCALTFTIKTNTHIPDGYITQVSNDLRENGLAGLIVSQHDKHILIRGTLSDDKERGKLVRLAQNLLYPVYLDVRVGDDLADALRASFNSRELYPVVQPAGSGSQRGLSIAGYLRDGLVEEWALSAAREDVPGMTKDGTPIPLERNIRHSEDVQHELVPALTEAKLPMQVRYLPGKVVVEGAFTVDQRVKLDEVLGSVQARLGVPIIFDIRSAGAQALRENSDIRIHHPAAGEQAAPSSGSSGHEVPGMAEAVPGSAIGNFKVVSVTMEPMRFISLASGVKVFEGGEMPGGYILDSIGVHALRLRKGENVVTYPLRGPK